MSSFFEELSVYSRHLAWCIYSAEKSAEMRGEEDQSDGQEFNRDVIVEKCSLTATRAKVSPPDQPDHCCRGTCQYQVQQQNAFEFLALQCELPRENSRCEHGYRRDGGQQKVVVGGVRKTAPLRAQRNQVERHPGDK